MKKANITTQDVQDLVWIMDTIKNIETNGLFSNTDASLSSVGVTGNIYLSSNSIIKIKKR